MDAWDAKAYSAEPIFHFLVSGLGFCGCSILSMAHKAHNVSGIGGKCAMMFWWRKGSTTKGGGALAEYRKPLQEQCAVESSKHRSFASIARTLLFAKRRLRVSPKKHLHFLYEPGKQVSSALKIKNTSNCVVAFKIQTNSPKSCFMRTPGGILTPGETLVDPVVKFLEPPEKSRAQKKSKELFRIVSVKVKQGTEFTPELFEESKDIVAVEQTLDVVYLNPESQSPEIEKLKNGLAEAEAALQARKKPVEDKVQTTVAAGGLLDEWKEQQQRGKLLGVQQVQGT